MNPKRGASGAVLVTLLLASCTTVERSAGRATALDSISVGDTSSFSARDSSSTPAHAAADVLRDYYAAIAAGDYGRAYRLWGGEGTSSQQTYDQFVAGFAQTAKVQATVGAPGRIEGAAGSRYVEVPVTVHAVTREGRRQEFRGIYVLRRVVIEGATEAQRRWHIDSATMKAEAEAR